MLASEILYRNDMEPEALIPAFVASGVSYVVYGFADGFTPIFLTAGHFQFANPVQLVWFAIIGLAVAWWGCCMRAASTALTRGFPVCVLRACCARPGRGVRWVHRAVLPEVLGTGYEWVQVAFTRQALLSVPLVVVLILPFARILRRASESARAARAESSAPAW